MNTLRHLSHIGAFGAMPVLAVIFLASAQPAEARPVSGGELGRLLDVCILSGGEGFDNGSTWGCCLPSGGWCVTCSGDPSVDLVCDFAYVRFGTPPKGALSFPLGPDSMTDGKGTGLPKLDDLYDMVK